MTESTIPAPRRGVALWIQVIIWVFLVGLLAIIAMGLRRAQQGTVQPGQKIDNFTVPLYSGYQLDGKSEINLDDLRGKVVVINFWASWCKPCEQEAAEIQQAFVRHFRNSGPISTEGEKQWWKDVVHRVFSDVGMIADFDRFFDEVYERCKNSRGWRLLLEQPVLEIGSAEPSELRVIAARDLILHVSEA